MGYFNTFFRVEITSTIIRFSVSQKNKYRGRTVASELSEMRSTGAYFLTVAIAGSNPACSTSFLSTKVKEGLLQKQQECTIDSQSPDYLT